jgi:hypothetical protein
MTFVHELEDVLSALSGSPVTPSSPEDVEQRKVWQDGYDTDRKEKGCQDERSS